MNSPKLDLLEKFGRIAVPLGISLALLLPQGLLAEHPMEHPGSGKMGAASCSMGDVADVAEKWAGDATKNGGLKIHDTVKNKDLNLSFMKVHRERLSKVGDERYFVCSDFKAKDGTVYDVDLFMKGKDKDNLVPDGEPTIHKVNGKPRYNWEFDKETAVWKKIPVKKIKATKKAPSAEMKEKS